jgi:hypothetical protein
VKAASNVQTAGFDNLNTSELNLTGAPCEGQDFTVTVDYKLVNTGSGMSVLQSATDDSRSGFQQYKKRDWEDMGGGKRFMKIYLRRKKGSTAKGIVRLVVEGDSDNGFPINSRATVFLKCN